jgi:hypothetical protein
MRFDVKAVAEAMEDNRHYAEFYLNSNDGKVVRVTRDVLEAVEDDDVDSIPDSSKEEMAIVESIIFDPKCPLIIVPNLPFSELLKLMTGFYKRVSDPELSGRLKDMTNSRNPTKRFGEILESNQNEQAEWIKYKNSFYLDEAEQWVSSLNLN